VSGHLLVDPFHVPACFREGSLVLEGLAQGGRSVPVLLTSFIDTLFVFDLSCTGVRNF
jgi:hypothetical protein